MDGYKVKTKGECNRLRQTASRDIDLSPPAQRTFELPADTAIFIGLYPQAWGTHVFNSQNYTYQKW